MDSRELCPKLIILIGIQGSGKSRWAMKRREYYRVCPDDIRREHYDDVFDLATNTVVHAVSKGMVIAALELNQDTVLDATNLNTPFRRNLYKGLPNHKKHARIFEIEPEIAIQRIKNNIKENTRRVDVPDYKVYKYYGDFLYTKKAILEENFDSIKTIDQESF
jgi:predicted kinase